MEGSGRVMKKERNIQMEVVRIFAMLMIILGHAVLYGHATESIKGETV